MNELQRQHSEKFWTWFIRNELELCDIRSSEDPILEVLLDRLQQIHAGFFFEISINADPHELIISAAGKRELFSTVDEFVAGAPQIPSWKFIALKPPQGFDFVTTYQDVDYDPKTFWFLPMIKGTGNGALLGLRVGIPNFSPERKANAQFAVLIILDTALGERSAAEDVDYLEVDSLPTIPEKDGFIELSDLPKFILWRKNKTDRTDPSTSSG